jgi:uncharacterized protein YgbK (DUF1537 family)
MTRFAIIADDLSSATDCGAQVVRSGLSVVVPLGSFSLPRKADKTDVISIDTDTRSLSAERAYERVKKATQQLVTDGWTQFYKSVDSTLRGNLGAEIEAVMNVVQPDCAIIAPAFPKYGRTTIDGVQYLHDRPLHETEFGTDPTAPVKDANIARRLADGSSSKAGQVTLDVVREGSAAIVERVQRLREKGVELVVVDIAEQEDLKRICLPFSQSHLRIVWVGSTGLAEFVPLAFGASSAVDASAQKHSVDSRPALALVGSASETTRGQLSFAQTKSGLDILRLDPIRMLQDDSSEFEKANSTLRNALEHNHDVALVVKSSREEIAATQQFGATLNLSAAQVAQQIVNALAKVACQLIHENRISGIVATGGDTANALCNALDAQALEILGEVEAGIPIMRVVGNQSLPLVTKAGGFGSAAAIQDALMKVKQYA